MNLNKVNSVLCYSLETNRIIVDDDVIFLLFLLIRPFVEFVSAPFWSVVSTRFRQAKNILLMAILSWIIFTVTIGLIKPPPHSCWREMNSTHQFIERVGYSSSSITVTTLSPNVKVIVKRQVIKTSAVFNNQSKQLMNTTQQTTTTLRRRKTTTTTKTTTTLKYVDEYDDSEEDNPINENIPLTTRTFLPINKPPKTMGNPLSIKHTNLSLVKPLASPILYEKKDVRNVFMVFLLLIIVGEFFSAPAITLAVCLSSQIHSIYCFLLGCLYSLVSRSRY